MAGCSDCPDYTEITLDGLRADGCKKKQAIHGEDYPGDRSGEFCCTYPKCPFGFKSNK